LFNRKRQGEVSKVTVDDYKKKGKAQNSDAELSLTDSERSPLKVLQEEGQGTEFRCRVIINRL